MKVQRDTCRIGFGERRLLDGDQQFQFGRVGLVFGRLDRQEPGNSSQANHHNSSASS
jgi:hypothetical protein